MGATYLHKIVLMFDIIYHNGYNIGTTNGYLKLPIKKTSAEQKKFKTLIIN